MATQDERLQPGYGDEVLCAGWLAAPTLVANATGARRSEALQCMSDVDLEALLVRIYVYQRA
jgi:hypothetical protein